MFLGDKGRPSQYHHIRMNYDVLIDNEKMTLAKLAANLGFYNILYDGKINEVETVYDTDKRLLTGAGLLIRKKHSTKRTYFSLVRISSMANVRMREKKSFLGECEPKDQPRDFPVQIAEAINKIFNNLFTINVVDVVKHCEPYIVTEITGNRYKIVSGTGYEAEMCFETLKIRDAQTGRKLKLRNFSLSLELNPNYEKEREHILWVIERYCKEFVPLNRNRFEVAEVAVRPRISEQPQKPANGQGEAGKEGKKGKKAKKSKKDFKKEGE